jgi:hypothetical protein
MTTVKTILLSLSIKSVKQKGRRLQHDDYTPDTVSDGCAKAFVVLALSFFIGRFIWTCFT